MRKREAEAIVDDIINEMRYMPAFSEAFEKLDDGCGIYDLKNNLIKSVMDEE